MPSCAPSDQDLQERERPLADRCKAYLPQQQSPAIGMVRVATNEHIMLRVQMVVVVMSLTTVVVVMKVVMMVVVVMKVVMKVVVMRVMGSWVIRGRTTGRRASRA